MARLSINELLFCVPNDRVGVISVCNNRWGNELSYISPDNKGKTLLGINDSVIIRLIDLECSDLTHKRVDINFPDKKRIEGNDETCGFEVSVNDNKIYMPFIDGGATTFVVTVNKGAVYFDAGSITSDKLLLDYHHADMNIGDEIRITIKKLDYISSPIRERLFSGCRPQ